MSSVDSPDRFTVRRATVADARGIAETHIATWRAAYRGLMPQQLLDGLSVDRRTAQWQGSLTDGSVDVWVITSVTDAVGGFVAVGPSRDGDGSSVVGELVAIYLRPEFWGRGAGRALHDAAVSALSETFSEATLWVLAANQRAREFYERHGWRTDGATKKVKIRTAELAEVRYRNPLSSRA